MNKDGLLKSIAETGYNVGFGAKKHFATFDIVDKTPGRLGFLGIAVGIFGLVFHQLASQVPSASLAVIGVASLYISFYDHKKSAYESAGKDLTQIFNSLRDLYRSVESGADPLISSAQLQILENEYYRKSISKQIFLSDWYAHYKFFSQHQIDWIDEQKHFTIKDKVPLSFWVSMALLVLLVAATAIWWWINPTGFCAFTSPIRG